MYERRSSFFDITRISAVLAIGAVGLVAACTPAAQTKIDTALATPAGQLFCAVQTASGPLVAAVIEARVSGAVPGSATVAVLATGAAEAWVNGVCAKAGGIPVSPPANPANAPQIAVITAGIPKT